jgi:tripartite-type tricarboxylate transporter receptor subunit TctC
MTTLLRIAVLTAALLSTGIASAQPYPNRPVKLIVPFPAGGPADLIARIIGQKLSEDFGKQFYVENHSGAGGNIGTGIGARAPADGYSLLVNSQAFIINANLYKSLPYDPEKDFAAVTRIATTPNVLVVHPSVPAKTVRELAELMRGSDARYHSYAQPGLGTPSHLSGELFRLSQKLTLTAIPLSFAITIGGGGCRQSQYPRCHPRRSRSTPAICALAVTAEMRVETLPDVPTMARRAIGQTGETPIGILAPTGTPPESSISCTQANRHRRPADVRRRLQRSASRRWHPGRFAAFLKAEGARWPDVIRAAGIKLQ